MSLLTMQTIKPLFGDQILNVVLKTQSILQRHVVQLKRDTSAKYVELCFRLFHLERVPFCPTVLGNRRWKPFPVISAVLTFVENRIVFRLLLDYDIRYGIVVELFPVVVHFVVFFLQPRDRFLVFVAHHFCLGVRGDCLENYNITSYRFNGRR